MAIKKAIFKIFNGSTWDEYHHKTDSAQVAHTNSDNSTTTAEAIFNGTTAKATLASGSTGDITLRKHESCGCIRKIKKQAQQRQVQHLQRFQRVIARIAMCASLLLDMICATETSELIQME